MKIKKMALATTAVTAALALSACGGGEATGSAGQAPPAPTSSAAGQQAQGPEIQQLQGFLAAWGAPESGGMPNMSQEHNMPGMEQNGMSGMSGMMSDQQMQQLEQASGVEFDRMWLQMMIAHHEGAVQMAQTELRDGRNPEAKALAQTIIDAQQTEITQMQEMLG